MKRKLLLTMKLTVLLLLSCLLQVSASGFAQNKITLSEKNVSLKKVLKEISRQSGFDLVFVSDAVKFAKPVNINVKEVSLEEALRQSFKNQPLIVYDIEGQSVIVKDKKMSPISLNQLIGIFGIEVKGKVLDETGQGVPGATVKVKGTGQGTVTDPNGQFILKGVDENATLQVSYLGYISQEVPLKGQKQLTVKLQADLAELSEVVVVGYGTQKKVNLTGAISVVKGDELQNRPVANATQSLQGLAPGLNVSVGGNTKPGQSFNLNIRGAGNISGGDGPFVLVDGLAMSLSDVNPNDIESISVLKDAAASAIYGARAPYGVILVTTKKGVADKTTLSYSSNVGLSSPLLLPKMANSYDFATYFNSATFNATGSKQYSEEKLALLQQYIKDPKGMNIFPEANDNYYSNWENTANGVANTDWFAFHYKPYAVRQSHNVSASGGNKNTQFFVSGAYYNEGGTMRYADINYDRYNLNASISSQLASWVKLKLNTKFTQSNYKSPFADFEGLFFHNLARMRPNVSPYDLNGNFSEMSNVPYLQSGSSDVVKETTLAILPGLELEPVKNWKIMADFNILKKNNNEDILKLPGLIYGIDGTPKFVNRSEYNIPLLGGYSRNMGTTDYFSPNIYSSYNYTLNEDHNFSVMAGFQQELNEYKWLSSSVQDLISADRPGISLATGSQTTQEVRNHWGTQGFFGRFNYNYKSKYLVEINGRYDGSSRFASDSRWGFFPSFSLGYNIAQEKFMEPIKEQISMLKLRGSYGFLGNQSGAGLYSYAQSMNITVPGPSGAGGPWYFQNGREGYINAPAPFNPGITWEKVQNGNIGLDFEALKSRLSGSIDIFQRSTKDMLGPSLDIADMYGGTPPKSNNANLRTNGWELSLTWRDKLDNGIQYSLTAMLSDNKSVVTKYQNPTNSDPGSAWYEGKKVGEIWGYRASGLIQTPEEAAAFNKLNHSFLSAVNWVPGDVNYLDLNGDGKLNNGNNKVGDSGDMTIIGNSAARYAYSFNGYIQWKGISVSALFQGIGKRDYVPGSGDVYFWGAGPLAQVTVFREHMDYWTPQNPGAYYPNPYAAPAGSVGSFTSKTQQVVDRYIQNAAYLRLKNATISYALPEQWIKRLKLSKVNVFVTGENLFTITKLAKMLDPETIVGGYAPGKIYPLSKVYSMGVNIGL
ncbi:SusC/RagA family TonB-linked outer membrane protein [Pedobacter sp. LMG 31462]|uniref:SusC/RagA family TonB-linked outer membrane protein n=2 Tax=Pedobacter gandavensis TaxID=2679963 RepID=A0ABR6EVM0_9SPHI|nr:SusC/RagA family TonB-linked outer membrane protein [Pedobacter gandavensis]